MELLISISEGVNRFYGEHDTIIRFVMKFFMAIVAFIMINFTLGQMTVLNNPLIIVGLAFLCAFLPSNSMLLIGMVLVMLHLYAISLEALLAGGGMLLVIMLLYFSIAPKTAFPLIMGAFATGLHVPGTAAILFGLVSGPLSAVGVGVGVIICRILKTTSAIGGNLQAASTDAADALMEKMISLILEVLKDREMFLMAGICVIVIWIVGMIRHLPIKYAWILAATAGLFANEAGLFAGEALLGVMIDYTRLGIEAVAGLAIAFFAQAFLFNLDYKKTEVIQFEDDEYVYYVKAVPKRKAASKRRI